MEYKVYSFVTPNIHLERHRKGKFKLCEFTVVSTTLISTLLFLSFRLLFLFLSFFYLTFSFAFLVIPFPLICSHFLICSVQYVVSFLFGSFMLFSNYSNCVFWYSFNVCFLVLYVCCLFCVLCVFCVVVLFCLLIILFYNFCTSFPTTDIVWKLNCNKKISYHLDISTVYFHYLFILPTTAKY
jgi:hypothetical protein